MRPFSVKFEIDVYDMDVQVFVGYQIDKVYPLIEDYLGMPMEEFDPDSDVEGFAVTGQRHCGVYLARVPEKINGRFAALVSHEMVHLAQQILSSIGCDDESTSEHYVLLQEFLVRKALEAIEAKLLAAEKRGQKKSKRTKRR